MAALLSALVWLGAASAPEGPVPLQGTIRAADSGAPIERFTLHPASVQWGFEGPVLVRLIEAPDGRFAIDDPYLPSYVIADGFAPIQITFGKPYARGCSGDTRLNSLALVLERGGSCSGRIVDLAGRPIAGVRYVLTTYYGAPCFESNAPMKLHGCGSCMPTVAMRPDYPWGHTFFCGITGEDGIWRLDHVPQDDYRIAIDAPGFARCLSDGFKVEEGRPAEVLETSIARAGAIEGVLADKRFLAMTKPRAIIQPIEPQGSVGSVWIDGRTFEVGQLWPGRYRILVFDMDHPDLAQWIRPDGTCERTVTVEPDSTITVTF